MIIKFTVLFTVVLLVNSFDHYVFGASMADALNEANEGLEGLLNSTSTTINDTSNQTTTDLATIDNNTAAFTSSD
jgi:hypothetical protein